MISLTPWRRRGSRAGPAALTAITSLSETAPAGVVVVVVVVVVVDIGPERGSPEAGRPPYTLHSLLVSWHTISHGAQITIHRL